MDDTFISLAEYIAKIKLENPAPFRSERNELFNQLYAFYEKSWKKNMWIDYIAWLKKNHFKHSKEKVLAYKKVAYPKISEKSFCSYWLGHIPTNDLYYLVSIAKDKDNRGENFNRWLFWALKIEKNMV